MFVTSILCLVHFLATLVPRAVLRSSLHFICGLPLVIQNALSHLHVDLARCGPSISTLVLLHVVFHASFNSDSCISFEVFQYLLIIARCIALQAFFNFSLFCLLYNEACATKVITEVKQVLLTLGLRCKDILPFFCYILPRNI